MDDSGRTAPSLRQEIDESLVRSFPRALLLAEGWLPLRRRTDGVVEVGVTGPLDGTRAARIRAEVGAELETSVLTPWGLRQELLRIFSPEIAADSSLTLWNENPALSARKVFSTGQALGLVALVLMVLFCLVLWPGPALGALLSIAGIVFLVATAFKFLVALAGARYDVVEQITDAQVARLRDEELPVYTVLVPVFREANIVADLIGNLGDLDYPRDKLEVLILVEEVDEETREAILSADPPPHFHLVTVPKGQPQTKPRACNVGLELARGEFLVIYDAEDTPDPDQLKKAVAAFRQADDSTVVLQASLNYFNADENLLTRMFTLEYNYWFYYMLAGLDALGLPIPLGGTSNHFRTRALRELGGWDPFNVTEDADLGIRAAALGYHVGVINSTTMEEANTSVPNFIRQRSRWIKGYMQTTLVHARRPFALIREVGMVPALAFVVLIGGTPATFLLVIPFTLLTAVSVLFPWLFMEGGVPAAALWLSLLNFLIGSGLMVHLTMIGPYKRGTFALLPFALLNPLYWLLHSLAAYKGLWQLLTRPHYWEKTEHGLTKQAADG